MEEKYFKYEPVDILGEDDTDIRTVSWYKCPSLQDFQEEQTKKDKKDDL